MEIYDYRTNNDSDLDLEIDSLSTVQRKNLNKTMKIIKQETNKKAIDHSKSWFQVAVLPILKDFAKTNNSKLEIQQAKGEIMIATFENQYGFDITNNCRCMKMLLSFAVHIGVDMKQVDEKPLLILTLIFDCHKILM